VKRLRAIWSDESGLAMLLVVFVTLLLATLGLTMIAVAGGEQQRSAQASKTDTSFAAAEAGINDYIAKLVDDPMYYAHYVHPGEATRRATDGTTVGANNVWASGLTWTYPNGKDGWKQVSSDYEYDLQITPPNGTSKAVAILSTGRKVGSTSDERAIEVLVRPASVADFQMMANDDVIEGVTASTYGKIYSTRNVEHDGVAHANVYAEGDVTGSGTYVDGAQRYDRNTIPTIRSVIKNPVNFNSFLGSLSDIQRAAQAETPSMKFDDSNVDAWRFTFQPDGTVLVQACLRAGTQDVANVQPTCGASTPYLVPATGAIYTGQTAIVSGQVKGRVTVASNDDLVVPDDISYVTSGQDVLGMIAKNDVIVAHWAPFDLTWRGAVLAETGARHSWNSDGSHGTATFTGSTGTNGHPFMDMFQTRNYYYDDTLLYLPPPWFPRVEEAYTVLSFRELPAS
jgi:Tfp pilus assembly protein PilX